MTPGGLQLPPGLLILQRRALREDLSRVCMCLERGCAEGGGQAVLGGAVQWDEQKLEQRNSHLNMRKSFFSVMVTEHWNRKVMEPPLVELFENHLGTILRTGLRGPCLS